MSEEEKKLLEKKVELSGKSKTDYLINALSSKPIVYVEKGNEILTELKRQGNNLNQAVKFHYFGHSTEKELLSVLSECKKLYKQILETITGEI